VTRAMLGALLVFGCAERAVIVGPDGDDAGLRATSDGDAGVDAGPAIEPLAGSLCDQQDDCDACIACSQTSRQACIDRAIACDMSSDCVAIAACLDGCGLDDGGCARACAARHPRGAAVVRAFLLCGICDACPADCRELHAAWCEEPPF
jgi:hypothetical protein